MARPPFNAEATTKEELEGSRSPEFRELEAYVLSGGMNKGHYGPALSAEQRLTFEDRVQVPRPTAWSPIGSTRAYVSAGPCRG